MANGSGRFIPVSWKYRLRCARLDLTSHTVPAWTAALLLYIAGMFAWVNLSRAHRILLGAWGPGRATRWLNWRIEESLARVCRQKPLAPPRLRAPTIHHLEAARHAGIVLKAPTLAEGGIVEKGVLMLKYTDRIGIFHECVNMEALLRHYQLVLEPSWTGYSNPDLLAYTRYRNDDIVVLSPFQGDHDFLEHLRSNLLPIELGAGDWVDPLVFRSLPGETKRFDMVMIARWHSSKRHDLLLRAIREIADPGFRVALVALRKERSEREEILMAVASSGLRKQIEILEDLAPGDVNLVLNQSKVNVLLSRQEGANRGLFEGFFAGVPGLAFRNHVGIRMEHFLPETGRLIRPSALAAELIYFREHWHEFNPRPWALSHIAPEISSCRLNEFLR